MILPLAQRAVLSLTTFPSATAWYKVVWITLATTTTAGAVAAGTEFIDPWHDWDPPEAKPPAFFKPLSALIFPSLLEEVFWRGALLPSPSHTAKAISATSTMNIPWIGWACGVLVINILSHPLAARTVWPRGRHVFDDPRFLLLATIVLGGATASFWISGGSAWAAALTHGVPVAMWRDFFSGEAKLLGQNQHDDDDRKQQ